MEICKSRLAVEALTIVVGAAFESELSIFYVSNICRFEICVVVECGRCGDRVVGAAFHHPWRPDEEFSSCSLGQFDLYRVVGDNNFSAKLLDILSQRGSSLGDATLLRCYLLVRA